MVKPKGRPDWGTFFKVRRIGYSTFYVTLLLSDKPISPDFTVRAAAVSWIRQNYESLVFEHTVLK